MKRMGRGLAGGGMGGRSGDRGRKRGWG